MPFEIYDDPGKPDPDTGETGDVSQEVLDQIEQDAWATITAVAEQISEPYTEQQQQWGEKIKAHHHAENRERLPDYGAIAPGELRAFGAYMYDYMFETMVPDAPVYLLDTFLLERLEVDMRIGLQNPEFLTDNTSSVWRALINEPGIVSALFGAGLTEEQAAGLLFALDDEFPRDILRPDNPCFVSNLMETKQSHNPWQFWCGQLSTIKCEGDPQALAGIPYPEMRRGFFYTAVIASEPSNVPGFRELEHHFETFYAQTFQGQELPQIPLPERDIMEPYDPSDVIDVYGGNIGANPYSYNFEAEPSQWLRNAVRGSAAGEPLINPDWN